MANHRLAAIMFTDIVGYTAIMAGNEGKALALLDRNRKFQKALIKKFGGTFLKEMGDGILASFPSSTDAVICAGAIMERAIKNDFKLRIGIHQGEVYFQNGDVFGSGVNIASRVEEITQPGQIFITEAVHIGVENKSGISTSFVYEKQLKNVPHLWKIYAVEVDQSQFADAYDPDISKEKPILNRKLSIGQILVFFGILGLGGLGLWQLMESARSSYSSLEEELRQKRVAVMIFENQTGDQELESLGKMVSDWITRGLIETGETQVVSAVNVESNMQLAAAGMKGSTAFSKATGAGVLIQGRYYLQGDELLLHSHIVDAQTGDILFALEPVSGLRKNSIDLLDKLTQQILGYWMLGDRGKFNKKPPKYDAYQDYLKVRKYWQVDDKMSASLLQKAYNADTTFYEALLKLTVFHFNHQDYHAADTLIQFIKSKDPDLSPWESLRLQFLEARLSGNHQAVAQAHLDLWKMDPLGNAFNAGSSQLRDLNKPEKAIEIWSSIFDEQYQYGNCFNCQWPFGRQLIAHHRLGNYQKVVDMVEGIKFSVLDYYIPMVHLWCLVRLDSLHNVDKILDFYKTRQSELERYPGHFELIWQLSREAYIIDKKDLAKYYALQLQEWLDTHPSPRYNDQYRGNAHFVLEEYDKALQYFKNWDQKNPSIVAKSRIGAVLAALGQVDEASTTIMAIQKENMPFDNGRKAYYEAIVRAAMGQKDLALKLLQQAYDEGLPFRWNYFQGDPYLKPLFGDPDFEELVRPKG